MELSDRSLLAIAEYLRIGLLTGCVQLADAVDWADRTINATDSPPAWVVDLCLAGSRSLSHVTTLLGAIENNAWREDAARAFLGALSVTLRSGVLSKSAVSNIAYQISLVGSLPEAEAWEIGALEDEWDLASNGVYGNISKAVAHMEQVLVKYEPFFQSLASSAAPPVPQCG